MNPLIHRKQKADASWSVNAEKVSQGGKKTRVQLGKMNPALYVAAKKISSSLFDRIYAFFAKSSEKYVEVNISNKRVLLNVNSVAKRLHLTKNEVLQAAKQGGLLQILIEKADSTEDVLSNYNEMMTHFFSQP